MDILPLELQKLGLKEKQVHVYLAGLSLGPSSVLDIAKKAAITRPTTYGIIQELEKKGLFEKVQKGKKRYFAAQSPEHILRLLRLQKRELEEKEREFVRIIAALEARYTQKESEVQVFKGKEGLQILHEQVLFTQSKDIIVFSSAMSTEDKKQRQSWYNRIQKRLGKLRIQEQHAPHLQGTLFVADKAIFFSQNKQEGYLIDNPLVVELFKSLL